LKLNGFGKLENKEINLGDHINLICGKNEAGKTTFLKFISGMFFGLSKNKNGKELADFDKYIPWAVEEFSGKIEYKLDNGESFEVFRDFKKKNPVIYNGNKEDISKRFNIDKNKGNEFFYEQTGIDENLWFNTSLVEQQEVVLSRQSQNVLTQKIANLLSTGNDNVSYQKSIDKLNKKLIEEVGTERSVGRPINEVVKKIDELNHKKELLEEWTHEKERIEARKLKLKEELENQLLHTEMIKEIKNIKEDTELEKTKIKLKSNIKKEYNEKIAELESNLKEVKSEKENEKTDILNKLTLLTISILISANILINIIDAHRILEISIIAATMLYLFVKLFLSIRIKSLKKKENQLLHQKTENIQKEIETFNRSKLKIEKEISGLYCDLEDRNKIRYNLINNKYDKLAGYDFKNLEDTHLNEIRNMLEIEKNSYDDIRIEINKIEIEEKNITGHLEKKALYEEELESSKEQKEELLRSRKSYYSCKRVAYRCI